MPAEAPASNHPIISVERFNYAYGDHQVLFDVDLPIRRAALEFPRLVAYCERMRQVYW